MSLLRPLDPSFPIERQIAIEAGPVVLVNVVTLDKADEQTFLKTWQDDAAFMKRQPGFISTQLHRALGESPTYLNYAVWESTAHFRAAFGHPEFRAKLSTYPPRSSLLHTCSRRSRCPTSASHSSRPTVGLGACGLELPATCPGEVILQIREKNRGKDNPSGRRCSLLPTMSSSERESRKLLRCKEGSYWHISDLRGCPLLRRFRG